MFKVCGMKNKEGAVLNPNLIIYARAFKFAMLSMLAKTKVCAKIWLYKSSLNLNKGRGAFSDFT